MIDSFTRTAGVKVSSAVIRGLLLSLLFGRKRIGLHRGPARAGLLRAKGSTTGGCVAC